MFVTDYHVCAQEMGSQRLGLSTLAWLFDVDLDQVNGPERHGAATDCGAVSVGLYKVTLRRAPLTTDG